MIYSKVLKEHGLKPTKIRCLMLQVLDQNKSHITAEQLHKLIMVPLPSAGLSSIYRNLVQLFAAGLILKHQFDDLVVYELNLQEHHDHLICKICNSVEEFVDHEIELKQKSIAKKHGFKLLGHVLNLYGVCSKCNQD